LKDSVFSLSQKMFYDISCSTPEQASIFLTTDLTYPSITYGQNASVGIPLPRPSNGRIFFEGNVFPSYESSYKTIWHLYLATLAHVAGHVKVTKYTQYQKWLEGKNKNRADRVIEYIENIRVSEFLKQTHQEYYDMLAHVIDKADELASRSTKSRDLVIQRFVNAFGNRTSVNLSEINEQILADTNLVDVAQRLYQSSPAIINRKYPFTENQTRRLIKPVTGLTLDSHGTFACMIESLNELWCAETSLKQKMWQAYQEQAKDLHFDKIGFVPERFSEYLVAENQIGPMAKQMSSQIKSIPNAIDDSISEDMGILEMQKAIQAIASQNASIQMFEQDDQRRVMEEWAILIDASSSMKIKFKDLKKLIVCFAQAANDMISKNGKWGMFCFNNDFNVIKADNERYSETVKARIGGIEMKGLSYLPDAITLSSRILGQSDTERKYLFVITDGLSLGYEKIDKDLEDAIRRASRKNINVVGIGIPQQKPTYFSLSVPYDTIRKMVSKFISTYTQIATSSL